MRDLERSASTFDKQGIINKRKKWAVIAAIAAVVLVAIIIGVAVSASPKKHGKSNGGKPTVSTPTTPPAASKASSASMRPVERAARMNGKVNPKLLQDFLTEVVGRIGSIPGSDFKLPSTPHISFNSLLMYIRDMNITDIYLPLLDYAESLDIGDISLTRIPAIVAAAKHMFTKEGLKEWAKLLKRGHDAAADFHEDHPFLNVTVLVPAATAQAYINTTARVPTRSNTSVAGGRRLARAVKDIVGRKLAQTTTADFPDLCIPVVFHVLQYPSVDSFGQAVNFPGTGYTPDALNLIDHVNYYFNNTELTDFFGVPRTSTNIQFTVGAVVEDPVAAPYLGVTEAEWSGCVDNFDLMIAKADAASDTYPSTQYINVIVCGDPGDGTGILGYAFVPKGDAADNSETDDTQYVFLRTDEFMIVYNNNADSFQRGSTTLAHELGHHLGLFHPHPKKESLDVCADGDDLADTPTTQVVQDQDYYLDLQYMCDTWRLTGSWPTDAGPYYSYTLDLMSSCPPDNSIDPVFNMMEYIPTSCYSHFTPQQVAYLQTAVPFYRPMLYQSSAGTCPGATTG